MVPKYIGMGWYRERWYCDLKFLIVKFFLKINLNLKMPADHASYVSVFTWQAEVQDWNQSPYIRFCSLPMIFSGANNNHKNAIYLAYFTLSSRSLCSPTSPKLWSQKHVRDFIVCLATIFESRFSHTWDTQRCWTTLGRLLWVFPFVSHALYPYFLLSFI